MAADLHRNTTVKEAVTVLSVGYGGTKNVTYAGQDGEKRECTRKETTVVNVHGRTRAALTVQELARLATPAGQPVSLVDPAAPDLARFPRFVDAWARAQVAELGPGDAVLIPSLWWHAIDALDGVNVLVNYWWSAEATASPFGQP